MTCVRCQDVIQPNRCLPCAGCGKDVCIDRLGLLLWPGEFCSGCHTNEQQMDALAEALVKLAALNTKPRGMAA